MYIMQFILVSLLRVTIDVDEIEDQFFFSEMGEYCLMVGDIEYDVDIFISGGGMEELWELTRHYQQGI